MIPRNVLFARARPSWTAASKLVGDAAVIFDTLATAISASLVDWLQKHGDRTNMEPSEFLANARIVAALMGVAGGELLIPTLVLLFGADIKLAGSLSLAVSLPTMIVGFARYSQDRSFTVLRPMAQADAWRQSQLPRDRDHRLSRERRRP